MVIKTSNSEVGLPSQLDKTSNGNIKIKYEMKYREMIDKITLTLIFGLIEVKKKEARKYNYKYSEIIIYGG